MQAAVTTTVTVTVTTLRHYYFFLHSTLKRFTVSGGTVDCPGNATKATFTGSATMKIGAQSLR